MKEEVLWCINPPGADQFYSRVRGTRKEIVGALNQISASSLDTDEVLEQLGSSGVDNVVHMFKKAGRDNKPVNLISRVEKCLETILWDRIYVHLKWQELSWRVNIIFVIEHLS